MKSIFGRRMKHFLLLMLTGICLCGNAQLVVEDIEYITKQEKSEYHFPNVISKASPAVADSINFTIRNDFFYSEDSLLPPIDSLFASVSDPENRPIYYDIRYNITTNNSRLLSISLGAEGCGAYCEYFTNYYNFDASNGHWLDQGELITPDGLKFLSDSMTISKRLEITEYLKIMQEQLAAFDTTKSSELEEYEYYDWAISEYKDCLEYSISAASASFSVKPNEIEFTSGRCLPHAIRNLDEVGDFNYKFSISSLVPYLTPYGKKLLLSN